MDLGQLIIAYNPAWTRLELEFFLAVFAVVAAVLAALVHVGRLHRYQLVAGLALLTYVAVVYASCVFTRTPTGRHMASLVPFWSWREVVFHHDRGLLKENLLNMVLLAPAGVLLPWARGRSLRTWELVLCGVLLSGGIELLQYVLERGFFEWDDIIHNTLGLVVGGFVSGWFLNLAQKAQRRLRSRSHDHGDRPPAAHLPR